MNLTTSHTAFFSIIVIITLSIALIIATLQVIGNWIIFKKAGEKGWKSIIPIYNSYVAYKLFWSAKIFPLYLILAVVSSILNFYLVKVNPIFSVLYLIVLLISCMIQFMMCRKLAFSFGKGSGFAVGLFFLTPIFLLILAFGNARYIGKN